MTADGRLARGKANHKAGKFKNNSETLEYITTLKKPDEEVKKSGKPKSR